MRKLASIRRVKEILPIENADRLELAKIDGWQCVVPKGDFKQGDLAVYFEIDSFLPIEDRYEFLRKYSYKKKPNGIEGFRLKTIKLRGVLSQGLLLPLKMFPELEEIKNLEPGLDLTKILNVKLYEEDFPLTAEQKGLFPSFIKKTDQERIQNLPEFFSKYKDLEFEATEKVDGTSTTIYYYNGEFGVCSRNYELKRSKSAYWQLCEELELENALKKINMNIALQCELIGPKIQKNPYKLNYKKYMLFDIYDIDNNKYFNHKKRIELFNEILGLVKNNESNKLLEHVPILEINLKVFQKYPTIDDVLKASDGKSKVNPSIWREGIVYKSMDGSVSFKAVSNKYLLKTS
ncbi:MAG: RNA ligase (ATP) [Promethearchaeota archaeon]